MNTKHFYLSFAGNEGFRGVVIAEADTFEEAVMECHRRKCNPGGEVIGHEFYPNKVRDKGTSEWLRNCPRWTVLSKEQVYQPVLVNRNADGTLRLITQH